MVNWKRKAANTIEYRSVIMRSTQERGETSLNGMNDYQSTAPRMDIRILENMCILLVGRKTMIGKYSEQENVCIA